MAITYDSPWVFIIKMAYGRKVRRELEQKVALAKMNKELCGEDEIIFNIPIDLGGKLTKVRLP